MRYLNTEDTKQFYDAWGLKQDNPGPYESLALDDIVKNGQWQQATSVFELGPGTGKFALSLLENHLPSEAHYSAWELSDTMLNLCRQRLQKFDGRVTLEQSTGDLPDSKGPIYDRIVANFVLDIFTPAQINQFFNFAYDNLQTNGLLCLSNLSFGQSLSAKLFISCWRIGYWFSPKKFGGCRPLNLRKMLEQKSDNRWRTVHVAAIEPKNGIPSEVLILKKI